MSLPPPGHVATTRLSGEEKLAPAGSGLVLAEWTAGPGTGSVGDPPYQAPLHIHHDEDEAWYVLDGRLRVKVGDAEHEVPAGGAVIGSRGLPHTFWNPDPDESVRYLLVMGARTSALLDLIHGGERPVDLEGMRALFGGVRLHPPGVTYRQASSAPIPRMTSASFVENASLPACPSPRGTTDPIKWLRTLRLASISSAISIYQSHTRFLSAVFFAVVGAGLGYVGVDATWTFVPRYRLTFSPDCVIVHTRWRKVVIPWDDIESWWVGVPEDVIARASQRVMVLATPGPEVTSPAAKSRRLLWSRRRRSWIICQPTLTDGTTEEILAALEKFAPHKRRQAQ